MKQVSFYMRPMALIAIGLGAGIFLGSKLALSSAFSVALLFLALSGACMLFRTPGLPLLLFCASLGLTRIQIAYPAPPAPQEACTLSGRVAGSPRREGGALLLPLMDAAVDGTPIDGNVWLTITDAPEALSLSYTQPLICHASIALPQEKQKPTDRDWRLYYLTRGISSTARTQFHALHLGNPSPSLYGTLLTLRGHTTDILISHMGMETGSIAAAMLHGDVSSIPEAALMDYRDSGIAHLLSVSGLHVGVLCTVLLLLLRRLPPKRQFFMLFAFLFCYCLFSALSPPTLRASLMALCMQFAKVLRRRNDILSSLALSFSIIVLLSPFALFDVGLQLSYLAVLGILFLQPPLQHTLRALPHMLQDSLAVSIAGQFSTFPVTIAYFTRLPLFAALANMLAVPLSSIVMLASLACLLFANIWHEVALLFAGITDITLRLMGAAASFSAGLGALTLPAPSLPSILLYYVAMLYCSSYCRGPKKSKYTFAVLFLGVSSLLWVLHI